MRRITQLAAKLTKEELFKKAQERFNSWAKMYNDPEVTAQQMYEDMSCSYYSGNLADDFKTESDVPWFLAVLKDFHIPAEYCVGLFSCWCSCEGTAAIAEKCMDIQAKYNIDMTTVWKVLSTNNPYPYTDWTEEVDRYKEAIK